VCRCDAREKGVARCRGRGTYFSNFVAVGPAHSGLSFSPSLSLGIVSAGGIVGWKDGIEELCGISAADGACVVELGVGSVVCGVLIDK
jgi:hypothetical protein